MSASPVDVRFAQPADLPQLVHIEDGGERMFDPLMDTSHWGPSLTGEHRAAQPGFLLVAGDPVVGFAHVLDLAGHLHLEQLDVLESRRRRGVGSALVQEVCRVAAARGAREVTLLTFAAVPWNAPFYARLGFRVLAEPLPDFLRPLRDREMEVGLDRGGSRVAMVRDL